MPLADSTAKRLPPERRRAQLMAAAHAVLARNGLEGFSLEEVAREAGVAPTLPRHYFESSERLLVEAVLDVVERVTAPLLADRNGSAVPDRMREYVASLAAYPWGHSLWMHSAQVHPEIDADISARRRLIVERALGRKWSRLSRADRMRGVGWIGACDAIVAEWIAEGARNPEALLRHLADASQRFGLSIT